MGTFRLPRHQDINQGVYEYLRHQGATLLDVRTPAEYIQGHIPGSLNVPLHNLEEVEFLVDSKDKPLYLYCQSGTRSRMAAMELQEMGYANVYNIGGIAAYGGKVEYS